MVPEAPAVIDTSRKCHVVRREERDEQKKLGKKEKKRRRNRKTKAEKKKTGIVHRRQWPSQERRRTGPGGVVERNDRAQQQHRRDMRKVKVLLIRLWCGWGPYFRFLRYLTTDSRYQPQARRSAKEKRIRVFFFFVPSALDSMAVCLKTMTAGVGHPNRRSAVERLIDLYILFSSQCRTWWIYRSRWALFLSLPVKVGEAKEATERMTTNADDAAVLAVAVAANWPFLVALTHVMEQLWGGWGGATLSSAKGIERGEEITTTASFCLSDVSIEMFRAGWFQNGSTGCEWEDWYAPAMKSSIGSLLGRGFSHQGRLRGHHLELGRGLGVREVRIRSETDPTGLPSGSKRPATGDAGITPTESPVARNANASHWLKMDGSFCCCCCCCCCCGCRCGCCSQTRHKFSRVEQG